MGLKTNLENACIENLGEDAVDEGNCSSGLGLARKIETAFNSWTDDKANASDGTTVTAQWTSSNSFADKSDHSYSVNYNDFNDKITIKLNRPHSNRNFQMFFFKQDKFYSSHKYDKRHMINKYSFIIYYNLT